MPRSSVDRPRRQILYPGQHSKPSILSAADSSSVPMAKGKAWQCSSCAYYEAYPGLNGVGTCDYTMSRRYGRVVEGPGYPCDVYVPSGGPPPERDPKGRPPQRSACEACHYWLPFATMPRVGQCDNPGSRHFREPEFSDKPTEECFVARTLDGLEFMWCESHRQTIYSAELPYHRGCRVFVSSVTLPVEDEMELTLAGD